MSLTPRLDRIQKNYLINGHMQIAQRGVSFVAAAAGTFPVDRFKYLKVGTMVHTLTQDTDVPTLAQSGYLFQNSVRFNLTTPDTTIAAGDNTYFGQVIEGYNWAELAQRPVTLSFWVKATLVGTYCVALTNSVGNRTFVAEYTIDVTNTWEYKTIHVSASPNSGTWNYTNGQGLFVIWTIAAGSNFHTSPNAWNTGNFLSTSNQVNGVNTGATDFKLTGVSLYEGTLDAPQFSTFGKDFENEVAACQRYYSKSYPLEIAPGTPVSAGSGMGGYRAGGTSSGEIKAIWEFPQRMRTVPVTLIYSPVTGAANQIYDNSGAADRPAVVNCNSSVATGWTNSGVVVNGNTHYWHFIADAEM